VRFSDSNAFDPNKIGFAITFQNVQRMQYTREALQEIIVHLKHIAEIVSGLETLYAALAQRGGSSNDQLRYINDVQCSIKECASRCRSYEEWARKSLAWGNDIAHLVGYAAAVLSLLCVLPETFADMASDIDAARVQT
jgi:hypothetical protein